MEALAKTRQTDAEIDPRIRPIAYGLVELLFDMTYFLREIAGDDLDCAVILICVNQATMRPFMEKACPGAAVLGMKAPPEEMRGSISRRMIAEKTGIARETVRRKVAHLIEAGLLFADENDAVRATSRLHEPAIAAMIERSHAAVKRYMDRIEKYGVD
jgi:biotin operon repressor